MGGSQSKDREEEKERKWQADMQERKRQAAIEDRKREAAEEMQKRLDAEYEQKRWEAAERVRKEEAEQERKREAKQELERQYLQEQMNVLMQERNAQIDRDRDIKKTLEQLADEIELEKWKRQEADRIQDKKSKDLVWTVEDASKLFMNYDQCEQSSSQDQSLGYDQERLKLLANFEVAKDSDEDLRNSFAATEGKEEGNDYFKDQKFEEAIESYSSSINKSPTVVAYSNRAMAYMKLNKMMEAENDCTKALEIDSQSFKAYASRAIAREKLGDNIKGALSDVEVALKLEPNNQEMKELHAKLIQMLG